MFTRGNIYTRQKEYHVFTTEDTGLNYLGIPSYNYSSIIHLKESLPKTTTTAGPNQGSNNSTINEIETYFDTPVNEVLDSLICNHTYAPNGEPKIMHFDKGSLLYVEQNLSQILRVTQDCKSTSNLPTGIPQFLKAYNESLYSKGGLTSEGFDKKDIINIAQKIQNSLSGCITFSVKYKALGCDRIVPIKLRILDKDNADDRRIVVSKGSPVIAGIPTEITGRQYSFSGTNDAPIGVYQDLFEGGIDNPKNAVAGQLDIRYNKTTGKWQSGTHQILARLITDVNSAKIGATDKIDLLTNPDSRSSAYDPTNSLYIGQVATGIAIPLSMENGNPYMYGPNYIGCKDNTREVEKISVHNRSNRIFKKGDVVLASQIDGEWIIQGFDLPTTSTQSTAKIWQFQKFIVDSDSFFKDERYAPNDEAENGIGNYTRNILPNTYEDRARKTYYYLLNKTDNKPNIFKDLTKDEYSIICRRNFYIQETDFEKVDKKEMPKDSEFEEEFQLKPSRLYNQATSFDQLHPTLGGTNTKGNVIGRTNIYKTLPFQTSDPSLIYQTDLPHFWGPVFPDGFTNVSAQALKQKENLTIIRNNTDPHKFLGFGQALVLKEQHDAVKEGFGIFSDPNDFNYYQLPADVGLNGPPISGLTNSSANKFSSPIERINFAYPITDKSDTGETYGENMFQYFYDLVGGKSDRYSYLLYQPTGSPTPAPEVLFDLKPVNPNRIQFSPLQLHAALSSTNITDTSDPRLGNLKLEIDGSKNGHFKQDYSKEQYLIWPQTFESRNKLEISYIKILDPKVGQVGKEIGEGLFSFGPYLYSSRYSSSPVGGPGLLPQENLPYEKSNLIGIIASKNSFSATNQINFTVKQNFGLPRKVVVTGAGSLLVSVLGPFLGISSQTGPSSPQQRGTPQWGDRERTDDITSFGTTALHVRIFDEWPDNQTYFDGRYFSVLHFNPAVTNNQPSEQQVEELKCTYNADKVERKDNILIVTINAKGTEPERKKYIIETSVDFTEPTLSNGEIVTFGKIINQSTPLLPMEYWKINPLRRGALLTNGGFRYFKKVIGLDPNSASVNINNNLEPPYMYGSGYKANDIINFPRGAKAIVQQEDLSEDGGILKLSKFIDNGSGFLPQDFPVNSVGGGSGQGASFQCTQGKVYYENGIDLGPQQRCPITRLTSSSDQGNKFIDNDQKTTINIDGNGKYDAFYFMHNDILHTPLYATNFTAGEAQYLTLEIS